MLLLIHGTGSSSEFWLPALKKIFMGGVGLLDEQIIDYFCLKLPGHLSPDSWFELSDTIRMIEEKVLEIRTKQEESANQSTIPETLQKILGSKKLYLVGHSVGGVIALNFTLNNPLAVAGLILTGCSQKFSLTNINILETLVNKIYSIKPEKLEKSKKLLGLARWDCFVDIINQNPEKLGLKSCIKIAKEYNFSDLWNQTSGINQNIFKKIPIKLINGYFDGLSTPLNVQLFKNFAIKNQLNFEINFALSAHDVMDTHPQIFANEILSLSTNKSK